jgi:hypothetical protein
MDIATIAIWLALILVAVGVVAVVIFGVIAILNGKFRLMSLGAMLIPIVVFLIALAISSGAEHVMSQAAILTSMILLVGACIALLLSGLRSFAGF